MTSSSLFSIRLLAASAALTLAGSLHAAPLEMWCPVSWDASTAEAGLIAQKANGVVSRSKHKLTIKTSGPAVVLTSKPGKEDGVGTYFHFCDRKEGYILISAVEDENTGGTLIEEATGKVRPGGQQVFFTGDRNRYFASTGSGSDLETWTLYGPKGAEWSGPAGIPGKGGDIVAHLTEPAFDSAGQLTAKAGCFDSLDVQWPVTLKETAGKRAWSPVRKCPEL